MKKYLLGTLLLLFIATAVFGQKADKTFKLTGAVVDSASGKGISSVNIAVLPRSGVQILKGTTSNETGEFKLTDIPQPRIRLKLSCVGYQSKIIDSVDLNETSGIGFISLRSTVIQMPDAIIRAVKPMVEFRSDRQIVNMDRVPGNTGSVTNALKNTGAVEVDPQSNKITVRGQDVKLQMDGHPFEMPSDMLAQMPASMIDQVEVILSPSAKESAEGGAYILNLVSKKGTLDNYNGSVSINPSTSGMYFGGLNFNYKVKKVNFFTSAFGGVGDNYNASGSERYNFLAPTLYYEKSDGRTDYDGYGYYVKAGADYNYDDNNSFTFYGTYNESIFNPDYLANSYVSNNQMTPLYSYKYAYEAKLTWLARSLYGFYKHKIDPKGHEITFDALYNDMSNPSDNKITETFSYRPSYPHKQNNSTGVSAGTFIFKTDYSLPLSWGKLEAGYNFTYRTRDNDYFVEDYSYNSQTWRDSLTLSNFFKYKENIHALYTTLSWKFGRFDAKAGLRAENLVTHGDQITSGQNFSENFFNLFPDFNIGYKFNDMFTLAFNAFRRVRYPMVFYVNPFYKYEASNRYTKGNPDIKPNFITSYALTLSQFVNAYYVYSSGMFTSVSGTERDSVTVNSFINLNNNRTYGIELTLPYYKGPMSPVKLPSFISMFYIQYGYNYRKQSGQFLQEDLSYTDNNSWIRTNLGLSLWYDVEATISFTYRSKPNNRRITYKETKDLSLYISRSFMDGKLKLNLSFQDLLNNQKYASSTLSNTYSYSDYFNPGRNRSVTLGITYMFNDFKERRDRNIDDGRDGGNKGMF